MIESKCIHVRTFCPDLRGQEFIKTIQNPISLTSSKLCAGRAGIRSLSLCCALFASLLVWQRTQYRSAEPVCVTALSANRQSLIHGQKKALAQLATFACSDFSLSSLQERRHAFTRFVGSPNQQSPMYQQSPTWGFVGPHVLHSLSFT